MALLQKRMINNVLRLRLTSEKILKSSPGACCMCWRLGSIVIYNCTAGLSGNKVSQQSRGDVYSNNCAEKYT